MATVKETILSYPGLDDFSNHLDTILIDRSIDGAVEYTKDLQVSVKLCAADLYMIAGNNPDFTENKLSITNPRSFYLQSARRLYIEGGEYEKAQTGRNEVPRGKAGNNW